MLSRSWIRITHQKRNVDMAYSHTTAFARRFIGQVIVGIAVLMAAHLEASADTSEARVQSPDGRNAIVLKTGNRGVTLTVIRDNQVLFDQSQLSPVLAACGRLSDEAHVVDEQHGDIDETFSLNWGKTSTVLNRCAYAEVTLANSRQVRWQVELRAYDDGVAFRYRLVRQDRMLDFALRAEETTFVPVGEPTAFFNTLESFTTSHESLYQQRNVSSIPVRKLMDCPLLLVWPNGTAATITEARVRHFAGMYLERSSGESAALHCRLSPLPSQKDVCVVGQTPHDSPWRVILLADAAGELVESNLLMCLNDPPHGDFSWVRPGKSTFHWWYGEFEDDYKLPSERVIYVARHRKYIDFCAENNIAYHAVSGDGFAWYQQSRIGYGTSAEDADVRIPRPELGLPEILDYAPAWRGYPTLGSLEVS